MYNTNVLICDFFSYSNIEKLLNKFELPEDNITTSNYEEAFNSLNSSYPDIVLGLDIKTCDMQTLLSEVTILMNICHIASYLLLHAS